MPVSSVKIIVSAHAGAGDNYEICKRFETVFNEAGIKTDSSLGQSGADVIALAREAADGPYEIIVAAGGDGTVNSIASAIVNTEKVLGVLPLGTLNHFARDLKIPSDLEAAAQTIVAGNISKVDVGE